MAGRTQLAFDFTPPRASLPELARAITEPDLQRFVQRVRLAGIVRLRQLKKLVDEAVRVEELTITDEDLPDFLR